MKDIKTEVDKFIEEFKNSPEIENIRQAIAITLGDENKLNLENIKLVEKKLNQWFKFRLYSMGRVIENLETISEKHDFGYKLGVGYSVEAKKDKINIGRYLLHLLLIIESKDREIKNLTASVQAERMNYLEMETAISDFVNDETNPEEFRKKFSRFYWLLESMEGKLRRGPNEIF